MSTSTVINRGQLLCDEACESGINDWCGYLGRLALCWRASGCFYKVLQKRSALRRSDTLSND